jgi:hypothetical protein
MKIWQFLLLFSIIIYSGCYYIILTIDYDTNDFIFGGLILGFLLLLFLSAACIAIRKEYKLFSLNNSLMSFKLTFICLIFFSVGLGVHIYLIIRDSSEVVFEAGQNFDLNNIKLEFREDETYKFTNGSALGNWYCRGNYVKNDSIITIDTVNSDKLLQSNLLAIRENKIFMIDSKHKIVDSTFYFILNN